MINNITYAQFASKLHELITSTSLNIANFDTISSNEYLNGEWFRMMTSGDYVGGNWATDYTGYINGRCISGFSKVEPSKVAEQLLWISNFCQGNLSSNIKSSDWLNLVTCATAFIRSKMCMVVSAISSGIAFVYYNPNLSYTLDRYATWNDSQLVTASQVDEFLNINNFKIYTYSAEYNFYYNRGARGEVGGIDLYA